MVGFGRRAARVDENQAAIVKRLRMAGYSVQVLSDKGLPDLLVACPGHNVLMEVKRPLGPQGGMDGRTLTPDQVAWHAKWRGPIHVVRSVGEALEIMGTLKRSE
jgi:hypothetical protein